MKQKTELNNAHIMPRAFGDEKLRRKIKLKNPLYFWVVLAAVMVPTSGVSAQMGRSVPPVHIFVSGFHQEWTEPDPTISQNSVTYGLQIAVRPNLTLRGNINQVVVDGDNLRSVGGLSDLQLGAQYIVRTSTSRIILDLAVSLPTGRTNLPDAAFQTSSLMALSQYDFRQPYFGQGRIIAPSVAWILTWGKRFTYSLGLSFRFKDKYKPFEGLTDKYNWGNEFVFLFGADWKFSNAFQLTADISGTSYRVDKFGNAEVYDSGNRWSGRLQLNFQMGRHDAGIKSNFRIISTNLRIFLNSLEPEPTTAFPDRLKLAGYVVIRFNSLLGLYMDAGATGFGEALGRSDILIYSTTFSPTVSLSSKISLPLHFRYNFGDLTGFEAGGTMSIVL